MGVTLDAQIGRDGFNVWRPLLPQQPARIGGLNSKADDYLKGR